MRKLIAVFLILIMILPAAALSDLPDISGLTFDELVELKNMINLAILNCDEWQEVKVSAGVWVVGEDIPAGHWTVRPLEGKMTQVYYCEKVLEVEKLPDHSGASHTIVIISESLPLGATHANSVDYNMQKGWYFICNDPVIISPYTGKPDLGFK